MVNWWFGYTAMLLQGTLPANPRLQTCKSNTQRLLQGLSSMQQFLLWPAIQDTNRVKKQFPNASSIITNLCNNFQIDHEPQWSWLENYKNRIKGKRVSSHLLQCTLLKYQKLQWFHLHWQTAHEHLLYRKKRNLSVYPFFMIISKIHNIPNDFCLTINQSEHSLVNLHLLVFGCFLSIAISYENHQRALGMVPGCMAFRTRKKVTAWFMPFCKFAPCQHTLSRTVIYESAKQQNVCFKNWCSQRHISRKDTRHHIKQIRQISNVWNFCGFQNCLRSFFGCSYFLFGFHFIIAWRNMFLVCTWSDKSTLRLIMTLPSSDSKSPKSELSQKKINFRSKVVQHSAIKVKHKKNVRKHGVPFSNFNQRILFIVQQSNLITPYWWCLEKNPIPLTNFASAAGRFKLTFLKSLWN